MARKKKPRAVSIIAQGAPKAYRGNLSYQADAANSLINQLTPAKAAGDHTRKKTKKRGR